MCVYPSKEVAGEEGGGKGGRGERWAPTLLKKHKNLERYAEKSG